jgi:glycosyltransferase involved in cell wall biosynthesis
VQNSGIYFWKKPVSIFRKGRPLKSIKHLSKSEPTHRKMATVNPAHPPEPIVSVIVPTFNREKMVGRAIDSVLAQTYPHFELIVVDDGSTDNTPTLLARYGHRIRALRCIRGGVSAARNCGIRAAAGGLIALFDSDDCWLPEKLAYQVDAFAKHPEIMIGQTEEIWIRNGVRVNPKRRHQKRAGLIFEHSLSLCLISPSAVMLRRSMFDEIGWFDESLPACEDYDFWLRITCRHPVDLIAKQLTVKYGGHPDQLSRMPELDKYRIQSIVKILRQGILSAPQREAARAVLAEKCLIYAAGCRKRGKIEEADYYLSLIQDEA